MIKKIYITVKVFFYIFSTILGALSVILVYYTFCVLPTNHKNTVGIIIGKTKAREDALFEFITQSNDTLRGNYAYPFRVKSGQHIIIQYIPNFPVIYQIVYSDKLDVNEIAFGTELPDSVLLDGY